MCNPMDDGIAISEGAWRIWGMEGDKGTTPLDQRTENPRLEMTGDGLDYNWFSYSGFRFRTSTLNVIQLLVYCAGSRKEWIGVRP